MSTDKSKAGKFHLVVVPADAEVWEFDSAEQLVEKMRTLHAEEARMPMRSKAFMYTGQRLYLTRGPLKYLIMPSGQLLPIFIEPSAAVKDDDGYIVDPVGYEDAPPPPKPPERLPPVDSIPTEEPDLSVLMDQPDDWERG